MKQDTPRVHAIAARGYADSGALYDRARPDYPVDAIEFFAEKIGLTRDSEVLDVASGTGKLAKYLCRYTDHLTAVEPVAGMRNVFSENLPQVRVLEATAEQLPFKDASLDAVTVGTAFHWFDAERAYHEIHRVLRPGGSLGLLWNTWSKENPEWLREVRAVVEAYGKEASRYRENRWRVPFDSQHLFSKLEHQAFAYPLSCSADEIYARMASVSFMAALPEEEKRMAEDKIRTILAAHALQARDGRFLVPYQIDVFWCSKL